MNRKDLEQIGELFDRKFDEKFAKAFVFSFAQIWEQNIEPAFDQIHRKIDTELVSKV